MTPRCQPVAGDDGDAVVAVAAQLKLGDGALGDLLLHDSALAVARVEVFGEAPRLFFAVRLEQLDDGARGVHPPGGVDARAEAEAEVGGAHPATVAAARDLHQRAQAGVRGLPQVGEAERDDRAVLADELRHVRDGADGDDLEKAADQTLAPAFAEERVRELEGDADAREILVRVVAAALVRVEDGEGGRRPFVVVGQVVIRDDHVEAVRLAPTPAARARGCRSPR